MRLSLKQSKNKRILTSIFSFLFLGFGVTAQNNNAILNNGVSSRKNNAALSNDADYEEISLSGLQLRGPDADAGWYSYLVVVGDKYTDSYSGEVFSYANIADAAAYLSVDKIKLYDSDTDETGYPLSLTTTDENRTNVQGIQHIEQNQWGQAGCFINYGGYGNNKFGGDNIYKVTIEKGCLLPFKTSDGNITAVKVDANYTFVNNDFGDDSKFYGCYNWTITREANVTEQDIELSTVQLRGIGGESDPYYLVLNSDSYNDVADDVEAFTSGLKYSDVSGIKLYTINENEELVAHSITATSVGANKWGTKGAFVAFTGDATLNGETVYKIEIPKGTKLVAKESSDVEVFTVSESYTFYNKEYGKSEIKNGAFNWQTEVLPYKAQKQEMSLSRVELRGDQVNNYLFFETEAVSSCATSYGEQVSVNYKVSKGIKLWYENPNYDPDATTTILSTEDTTGNEQYLSYELEAVRIGVNLWGEKGLFIDFGRYSEYNGKTVKRITVDAGTEIAYGSVDGDKETAFVLVIDESYTFENKKYGVEGAEYASGSMVDVTNEPKSSTTISLSGIQMRGWADNGWYQYLVLLSDAYNDLENLDNSGKDLDYYLDSDKITLKLSKEDEGKTLTDLTVQHVDQSFSGWSKGAYINFAQFSEYNGSTVYSVSIKKGCRIPAMKDGEIIWLVVDQDYTFFNSGYQDETKAYGSFEWSTIEVPTTVENTGDIVVRSITNQSDGIQRWLILWFNETFVGTTDATFFDTNNLSNILDNILLYSGNDLSQEPITLRSVFKGAITIGQFGSPDAIGFEINNDENINGSNLYTVVIKEGAEVPFFEDDTFSVRTTTQDYVFLNNNYGRSGEIEGETGTDSRTYENWCIDWSQASFVNFDIKGLDKEIPTQVLKVGDKISLSEYQVEGYELTVTDSLGNTYYDEIIVPSENTTFTFTYTEKGSVDPTPSPTPTTDPTSDPTSDPTTDPTPTPEKKSNLGLILGTTGGSVVLVGAVVACVVIYLKKRK